MTFSSEIVADFAVIMTIAAIVVILFYWLKQPLILGYLIAGIIIGPYTPPFSLISRVDVVNAAADLGVILLLFSIGLEFPLSRFRDIGFKVPLVVSIIEIALMFLASFGIGWLLGWSLIDSLFLGTALASSSTVIIAKVLTDLRKLKDTSTAVMMAVLVAEDLFVVLILALITSIFGGVAFQLPELVWTVGKIILFIAGSIVIGFLVVPRVIDRTAKLEHNEILILVALGLCFGLSVAANLMGLSMAIGAFIMGILVANAVHSRKIAALISPIRHMFAAMFFVSMGALIDITQFQSFLIPALIITIVMIAGKMIGCGLGTRIMGYDASTALKVGLGMGQIGEFAFIVVKSGQDLNLISPIVFPVIGVAVAITAFLTPYSVKLSYKINPEWMARIRRRPKK